ncbi:MAG: hypothetical protein KBT11_08470 [Treponema sp.]|nr:hypothetical protein [Candidatus Treponema equifaecale]
MFIFSVNSQESQDDDSLDDLFSDASDVDEAVITEKEKSANDFTLNVGSLKLPFEFSGDLKAEVGGAYIWSDGNNDTKVYFDLQNKINFATRPDKYLALKGSFKTSMPDTSDVEEDGQNHYFYLYELYFDYLMLNRIYITAGKKEINWGNVRLFTNTDDYEDDEDALYTNVLKDSRNDISGNIRIPIGPLTLTGVVMFKDSIDDPSWTELSFAGNAELIFLNTCFNLFFRTFPERSGKTPDQYKNPIAGVELKRTVLGFDFYAQEMARVSFDRRFRDILKPSFYEPESFNSFVTTAGFYRLYTEKIPYFGFNFEFQNIYYPNDTYKRTFYVDPKKKAALSDYYGEWVWANENGVAMDGEEVITDPANGAQLLHKKGEFVNRFAFSMGLSKLGRDKNVKVGLQWNHDITNKTGFVKPGVIFSRIMPHCDWNVGVKYEYGDKFYDKYNIGKFTMGTYLKIKLDY